MKPFHIKLSDEHRVILEAYRRAEGLRSEADAIRSLIESARGLVDEDGPGPVVKRMVLGREEARDLAKARTERPPALPKSDEPVLVKSPEQAGDYEFQIGPPKVPYGSRLKKR